MKAYNLQIDLLQQSRPQIQPQQQQPRPQFQQQQPQPQQQPQHLPQRHQLTIVEFRFAESILKKFQKNIARQRVHDLLS